MRATVLGQEACLDLNGCLHEACKAPVNHAFKCLQARLHDGEQIYRRLIATMLWLPLMYSTPFADSANDPDAA